MKIIKLSRALLATSIVGATTQCAGLDASSIGNDQEQSGKLAEQNAQGFRYFEPAPFLLVHSDGKGGVTGEIVWLPDTTVKRSIRPYAWLAKNSVALQFSNGLLTQASTTADETVIPNAIISDVSSLAKVLTALAVENAPPPPPSLPNHAPVPYLYKIQISGNNISLKGGPPPDTSNPSGGGQIIIHATLNGSGS